MDASQKGITVGLTLAWLISLAVLILALRSLLGPLYYSVWILIAWIIVEMLLSFAVLANFVWFVKELLEHEKQSIDSSSGAFAVLLCLGMLAYAGETINLGVTQGFAYWSIVNFVLLSLLAIIDIAIYRDRN